MHEKPRKVLIYASRLMKGHEMREACKQFRLQDAETRRQQFVAVPAMKEASGSAGERVGSF